MSTHLWCHYISAADGGIFITVLSVIGLRIQMLEIPE